MDRSYLNFAESKIMQYYKALQFTDDDTLKEIYTSMINGLIADVYQRLNNVDYKAFISRLSMVKSGT